jgi:uncharacterized protein (DUF1330 family)
LGPKPTEFFFDRLQEIKTMTVYVIADIKVTDDGWVPAYAASVHDIVHKHGGKYLSRSGNVKTLEGNPLDTTFIALLEFPSAEAVKAFATDPKYAPHAAARQAGSESRFQLIDDTDVAGTNSLSAKRMIRTEQPTSYNYARVELSAATSRTIAEEQKFSAALRAGLT